MRALCKLGAIAILLLMARDVHAVYETVTIEKPFHARSVSGVVVDPSGAPVSGVTVDDCDPSFERVVRSTTTAENGSFDLPKDKKSVHYLSFRARGFNPLRITVVLRTFAHANFRVKLPIGG